MSFVTQRPCKKTFDNNYYIAANAAMCLLNLLLNSVMLEEKLISDLLPIVLLSPRHIANAMLVRALHFNNYCVKSFYTFNVSIIILGAIQNEIPAFIVTHLIFADSNCYWHNPISKSANILCV
jgi:hypothetical protein